MKQLLYIVLLFLLCSCNDWLDIRPEASVDVDELFSEEEGFIEAVNGLYTNSATTNLYGGIFTVEIQDALAQNYSYKAQDYTNYLKTSMFDFSDDMFKWRNEAIWSAAYNVITNCNLILENIEQRKDIFHEGIYEIVKGEALALRAYIHFDLLRFFAPPYAIGASQKAIPYVTTYSNKVTPLSTVEEVTTKVLEDLTEAKRLLAGHDPIQDSTYIVGYNTDDKEVDPEASTEMDNPNLFLQNRRHRLNYYAVCGTLARVYLYEANHTEALKNALEVINSEKFKWVDSETALAEPKLRDRLMYTELVFSWYVENEKKNLADRFGNVATGYFINSNYARSIYEVATVGADDYRYKGWFLQTAASGDQTFEIEKYLRNSDDVGNRHYLVAPAIRLSEMYYIAAESVYPTDPDRAWQYLNTVRSKRGIRTSLNENANFIDELLKEYRKETYAEGQAFYAYKRLNKTITSESGIIYQPSQMYPIPLPDNEIEFGNR